MGRNGLQYIYHPIAYGPFLADKYGYPSISKLHQKDPIHTKKNFWGKQGILRVITYTQHSNLPVGHVALWDCNKFFQSKDWIAMHSLITVEFWESPGGLLAFKKKMNNRILKTNKSTYKQYNQPSTLRYGRSYSKIKS